MKVVALRRMERELVQLGICYGLWEYHSVHWATHITDNFVAVSNYLFSGLKHD